MPVKRYTPEKILKLLRLDGLARTVSWEIGKTRYLPAILRESFRPLIDIRTRYPGSSSKMAPSGCSKTALATPAPCKAWRLYFLFLVLVPRMP